MNEFLTENSLRCYPLSSPLPAPAWGRVLVDASVACHAAGEIPRLKRVEHTSSSATFIVGVGTDSIACPVNSGSGKFSTVFAKNSALAVWLTVDLEALAAALDGSHVTPALQNIEAPFCLRCCSIGADYVSSISAYSAGVPGTVFSASEIPAKTIAGGDVTIAVKDGLDVEPTTMLPVSGDMLRISALPAALQATAVQRPLDVMVRGDECMAVEAIPNAKVASGGAVVETSESKGVVRITSKCKPCCQCGDYKAAVDLLAPGYSEARRIKALLDSAKQSYDSARAAFNSYKTACTAILSGPDNVHISVAAMGSAASYTGATTSLGRRRRVSVSTTILNMSPNTASISGVTVSGMTGYTMIAHSTSGGDSLAPGAVRTDVRTYASDTLTNSSEESAPRVTVSATVSIPGFASKTISASA